MVRLGTIIHGLQRGKSYLPLSEMPLAGTDPEGPTLIIRVAAMGVEVPSGYFRGLAFLKKFR
jgi:hypothetical protein